MKRISMFWMFFVLLAACSSVTETPPATPTATPPPTITSVSIPLPVTPRPFTRTAISIFPVTPVPVLTRTTPTTDPNRPGLVIKGYVRLSNGSGLAGVKIYRAFATDPSGLVAATTNQTGFYQSELQFIPGDETIRVWAELDGYTFGPASETTWQLPDNTPFKQAFYFWRHYYGREERTLDFIAKPK